MKAIKRRRKPPKTQLARRPTLNDIAKALSVTPATVSKALRDSSDISQEMKELVKKTTKELGYRPNLLARALINKETKILGVLVPDLRISFFSEALRGMYEEAATKGYECLFLVHDELDSKEKQKLEFLSDIHVDGLLLNPVGSKSNHQLYQRISQHGTRIVSWDRNLKELGFRSVTINDVDASYKLTSKIIKEGRKRILFLGPHTGISVLKDRFKGYKMALADNGIPFRAELVLQSFRSVDDSYAKLMDIQKEGIEFDAIVSIGGLITYGAGRAVLKMNRSIPGDVVLGEFGDNDVVYKLGVPFYTVCQNPYEIGKASTDMLIQMIESGKPDDEFKDIVIESQVVERLPIDGD